jgi:hypothetical protein
MDVRPPLSFLTLVSLSSSLLYLPSSPVSRATVRCRGYAALRVDIPEVAVDSVNQSVGPFYLSLSLTLTLTLSLYRPLSLPVGVQDR